MEFNKN